MTTPNIEFELIPTNSLQPGVAVNEALFLIDALMQARAEDKDLVAAPVTVAADAGKMWIIGTDLLICVAANVFRTVVPKAGWRVWVVDEALPYRFDGAAWVVDSAILAPPAVVTEATAARAMAPSDAGKYLRFTAVGAKTATFDSASGYTVDQEFHLTNRAASDNLTLTPAGTMVLNAPKGGTLVLEPGDTVTVKMVSATEADVMGSTEAA